VRTARTQGVAVTFKSKFWQPLAFVLSAANLVAVGFAASTAEPWHAGVHAGLALAFGLWAQRLKGRRTDGGSTGELQEGLEALEVDVNDLRRELSEAMERLDFTERMLTQRAETRRSSDE
jgi:hypothetical protein